MKRCATAVAMCGLSLCAMAQTIGSSLQVSHDSDGMSMQSAGIEASGASGIGARVGLMRYAAPAGWSASGEQLLATYRHKGAWLRADVDAGLSRLGGAERFVGLVDVAAQLGPDSSIGISAQRDWVDSRLGIERAMTYDSIALVGDHAFNNRFNVGLAAGQTAFSGDNRRPFLRTRWNVSLIDAIALNAYLKTRSFKDTNPNRPEYFSPARLNELSLGVSARVAAGPVSLHGAFDAGRQYTPDATQPIWSLAVGVASARAAAVQWSVALQATNTAALFGGVSSYRCQSLVARLSLPF